MFFRKKLVYLKILEMAAQWLKVKFRFVLYVLRGNVVKWLIYLDVDVETGLRA